MLDYLRIMLAARFDRDERGASVGGARMDALGRGRARGPCDDLLRGVVARADLLDGSHEERRDGLGILGAVRAELHSRGRRQSQFAEVTMLPLTMRSASPSL